MLSSVEIAALKGGTAYDLVYANVDRLYSVTHDSTNWSEGLSSGLSTGTQLVAETSAGGTWDVAIPIGALADIINAGIHLTYEGSAAGVTMSYSLDGTIYTAAQNRRTILEGTNVANTTLFVRLALADDAAYVDSLTVDVLANRTMAPVSGVRQLTFTNTAMDQTPAHQSDLSPEDGADIALGGYMEILPDTSALPVTTKTIEFWLKKNGAENSMVLDTTSGKRMRLNNNLVSLSNVTAKINDVTVVNGTTTIPLNTWLFFSIQFTAAANELIRIGNLLDGTAPSDINVYGLALYTDVPTSTYQANTTAVGTRIDDTSVITLTEKAPAVDIYAYAWTNGGI